MRPLQLLTLAIALSFAASSVLAKGQERPGADKRYCQTHLQANADRLRANFQALDADHNGVLTERESGLTRGGRLCFSRLDRDHDRGLTASELVHG